MNTQPLRPIVLDSGCGTADSTQKLGLLHPKAWVIGIDQSAFRLRQHLELDASRSNVHDIQQYEHIIIARAELVDFWRLLCQENYNLAHHYILYPNPWPKKAHVTRRWHGHPVFPTLLKLGKHLTLRSNWMVYIQEFQRAVELATTKTGHFSTIEPAEPISPFEKKYQLSEHTLYEYNISF